MSNTLGERIKALRKEKGLTQLQLAEQLNITDKAVSKWESGDGNPDITLLPVIANIFNVSLDYLLTGKVIDNINLDDLDNNKRLSYLIKKDDAENFIKYGYNNLDNIFNKEIYTHESIRVFSVLIDEFLNSKRYVQSCLRNKLSPASYVIDILNEFIKMCALANRIDALEYICFPIFAVGDGKSSSHYSMYNSNSTYLIKESTLDFIYTDERISKEMVEYISSLHFYSTENKYDPHHIGINFFMNDIIVAKLYEYKKFNLLDKALIDLNKNLDYSLEKCTDKTREGYSQYRFIEIKGNFSYCCEEGRYTNNTTSRVVAVIFPIKKALELAKEAKDLDWVVKFNEYNLRLCNEGYVHTYHLEIPKYYLTEDEIELIRLESDPNSSEDDILLQKYTSKQIINLEGLISDSRPGDSDLNKNKKYLKQLNHIAKDLIDRFYINEMELIEDLLNKKDFTNLFKFAVDRSYDKLVDVILGHDPDSIMKVAFEVIGTYKDENLSYKKYFNQKKLDRINDEIKHVEEKIQLLNHIKEKEKLYNKACEEINEDYINNLIGCNDLETAVIKLCVRLEATLKHKYGLEGDLFDMIDTYLSGFEYHDIDALYYEAEMNEDYVDNNQLLEYTNDNERFDRLSSNLHDLRKVRNSIVHMSEKVSYSAEDVKEWSKIIMEEI